MDTSKRSIPWPLVGGACLVLVLLACGVLAVFGAGAGLLISRLGDREPVGQRFAPGETAEQVPGQAAREPASLQDLRGVVEVQENEGIWMAAAEGQALVAGQRVRTGSLSRAALVFPDGSRASLLANAELSIDELAVQTGAPRAIVLTQWAGESNHAVAADKRAGARYVVNTPSGLGEARGTVFNVVVTPDQAAAYYVVEGAVDVTGGGQTVTVSAGQVTTTSPGEPPLDPVLYVFGEGVVAQTGPNWIINNQEFQVSESTIIIGEPQVGDWVIVRGRLLDDGVKVADWIVLVRSGLSNRFTLTGLVDAIAGDQWTVNGQVVALTSQTEIDPGIVVGDKVRVEGPVLDGGVLEATRIEKLDEERGQSFDFTGVVASTGPAWVISGVAISTNEETVLTGEVEVGALVRVKGWILPDGSWLATSITLVEEGQGQFSFTGIIESIDPWVVAGISFETRAWTEIEEGLAVGDLVRVEGLIDENGVWIAAEIEKIDPQLSRLVLFGMVFSIDPWIVSGFPLVVTDATIIDGEVSVGMLVRVEIIIQADGSWLAVRITPLPPVVWFPGCIEVVARVVSLDGNNIILEGWPALILTGDVQIDGDLAPGSLVRVMICFGEDGTIHIVYIIIVVEDDVDLPEPDEGGKVILCHKPNKKGGNTLSVGRSALDAHLGHGDYIGACR